MISDAGLADEELHSALALRWWYSRGLLSGGHEREYLFERRLLETIQADWVSEAALDFLEKQVLRKSDLCRLQKRLANAPRRKGRPGKPRILRKRFGSGAWTLCLDQGRRRLLLEAFQKEWFYLELPGSTALYIDKVSLPETTCAHVSGGDFTLADVLDPDLLVSVPHRGCQVAAISNIALANIRGLYLQLNTTQVTLGADAASRLSLVPLHEHFSLSSAAAGYGES